MADPIEDDGLPAPIVGDWAEEKYRLVECYAQIFATSMKGKWDELVYVDLFAGSGCAKIRGTRRTVRTTALRVLDIPHPFDRYIFADLREENIRALAERVRRHHPGRRVAFHRGDSNEDAREIVRLIPHGSASHTVLSFCFLDPFQLSHLRFATIERLAERYVDFLVLIPTGMDAGRNQQIYTRADDRTIEQFTGSADWRSRWRGGQRFGDFVVEELGRSMMKLGYRYGGLADTHQMRNTKRKSPIYRLAVFSRNALGAKFWDACRKFASDQGKLF